MLPPSALHPSVSRGTFYCFHLFQFIAVAVLLSFGSLIGVTGGGGGSDGIGGDGDGFVLFWLLFWFIYLF